MGDPAGPAPPTPQQAAVGWVEAVMDRSDLRAAWPLTDPRLRLVLAQDWIWAHRHHPFVGHGADWDALARALAAARPDHHLWARFSAELLELWQKMWKGFNARTWGPRDGPEVIDLDLEMVTFVEVGGAPGSDRDAFARRFAMRHGPDGWRVASIHGDQLFAPGWPPSLESSSG
ncbi:MAG: hypothetical protein ABR511_11600 [Acidimicrobiales bacterium]